MHLFIIISSLIFGCNGSKANVIVYNGDVNYDEKCVTSDCYGDVTIEGIKGGFIWSECTCSTEVTPKWYDLHDGKPPIGAPYGVGKKLGVEMVKEKETFKFNFSCKDQRNRGLMVKAQCIMIYP
jgi:hypothetical protein